MAHYGKTKVSAPAGGVRLGKTKVSLPTSNPLGHVRKRRGFAQATETGAKKNYAKSAAPTGFNVSFGDTGLTGES